MSSQPGLLTAIQRTWFGTGSASATIEHPTSASGIEQSRRAIAQREAACRQLAHNGHSTFRAAH